MPTLRSNRTVSQLSTGRQTYTGNYAGTRTRQPNPSRQRTRTESKTSVGVLILAACFILAGIGAVAAVVYRVNIRPKMMFVSKSDEQVFTKDALAEKPAPAVPVDQIFSRENMVRYYSGIGLQATFRIENDPNNNYATTTFVCGFDPWKNLNVTMADARQSDPERRALVDSKRAELEACVAKFDTSRRGLRTIEIYMDETEGIGPRERAFVEPRVNNVKLVHPLHTTKVNFFNIIDATYRDYYPKDITIPAGSNDGAARRGWDEGLKWLLRDRDSKGESSIATGLFNALRMNENAGLREVYVFSDGMENHRLTSNFYLAARDRQFLAPQNWKLRDTEIQKVWKCPDLSRTSVTWYMPPRNGDHYPQVREYWEHVLKEVCLAKSATVIF